MTERAGRPWVIAHRGASGERSENTLPAYALAIEQGADMIEIDLHRTRDGAIAVTDDEHLPGLPGAGTVGAASLAELKELDAGDGERIPSLDEVLDRFGAAIAWNLELKAGPRGPYPGLEEATLAALAARGLGARVLFSSFDDRVLARLRALEPAARLGVLVGRRSAGWAERCRAVGAEAVHFGRRSATRREIARAHELGLAVYVYTVDDPAEMRALLEAGADGLFTNWPARMREVLVDFPRGKGQPKSRFPNN